MDPSETQIIAACQAGNLETFVTLYDRYVDKIYKFLYYRTGHKELAEDLTSQTFFKAMDRIQSYRGDSGSFQAWLYQIARNNLIDDARKRKPVENIDTHFDIASNEDVAKEAERESTIVELNKLIQELPEESQELIRMRLWDELPYSEIATITGKSEGGLKMQFSRVMATLKQQAHFLLVTLIFMRL